MAAGDSCATWPLRRVYRIEHPETRLGPFANYGKALGHRTPWEGEGPYGMPEPDSDRILRGTRFLKNTLSRGPYACAFPSIERLLQWFAPVDLCACAEYGFRVRIYGVAWEHHTLCEHQVIFHREHAVVLRDLPIVEMREWFVRLNVRRMAA